ncbi:hypothetical protein HK104_009742 [Borealophlyctis nickersoniae]|nr:hypothetical protein HK104_009742 [Borealophlyctis nickersoniae]
MEPGLLAAYLALGVMAVVPIYFGSMASLKIPKKGKGTKKEREEDESEFFSLEDAKMFPILGSATLLSLYVLFTYFDKAYINILLTVYFSLLGVGALVKLGLAMSRRITGWDIKGEYRIDMWKHQKEILSYHFGTYHLFLFAVSIVIAAAYAMSKHWIISNLYGEAFSASAVQLLNLDSFKTGTALLAGLFFYDIFWVFGTDVMVTVAKSFDAPVKVVWPKDIWALVQQGLWLKPEGAQFTMLGLGDIVIPGIYVALCLQFDHHQYLKSKEGKKNKHTYDFPKPYFTACFIAYCAGLVTTVVVMHTFQAAQPALLYLSPACIFSSLITGLIRGEIGQMFSFDPSGSSKAKKKEVGEGDKTAVVKQEPAESTGEDGDDEGVTSSDEVLKEADRVWKEEIAEPKAAKKRGKKKGKKAA